MKKKEQNQKTCIFQQANFKTALRHCCSGQDKKVNKTWALLPTPVTLVDGKAVVFCVSHRRRYGSTGFRLKQVWLEGPLPSTKGSLKWMSTTCTKILAGKMLSFSWASNVLSWFSEVSSELPKLLSDLSSLVEGFENALNCVQLAWLTTIILFGSVHIV